MKTTSFQLGLWVYFVRIVEGVHEKLECLLNDLHMLNAAVSTSPPVVPPVPVA
jgi:hypothetical protein